MQTLELRKTHRYVGTYSHLDAWETVGTFEVLGKTGTKITDEEDPCEPFEYYLIVRVVPSHRRTTVKTLIRALEDCHSRRGCAHEYDCCGCYSYCAYAWPVCRTVEDRTFMVRVTGSRNY